MNREYYSDEYMPFSEDQASQRHQFHQHPYGLAQPSTSAASYGMTAGGGGGAGEEGKGAVPPTQQHQHNPNKRRISHYDEYEAMSGCEGPVNASQAAPQGSPQVSPQQVSPQVAPQPAPMSTAVSRRRGASSYGTGSTYDDDGEDSRSTRTLPDKRQNHSEIEKRRRDKMNTYITELSALIPMCSAMARKLDKLTVLRMAVQHLRSLRGALSSCPLTSCPRPAYITEQEVNELVLDSSRNAFVLVVSCDRGRLLYVSASVTVMLHYDKSELLGQSLFDILHPKDVAKVKEQLSSSDLSPRERLIDAKTMLPVKAEIGGGATRFCPGARRSFFCRIKTKAIGLPEPSASGSTVKDEIEPKLTKKKYCVVQCTGYLKSWAPAEISESEESGSYEGGEEDACNMSCLVAVGRSLNDLAPWAGSARVHHPIALSQLAPVLLPEACASRKQSTSRQQQPSTSRLQQPSTSRLQQPSTSRSQQPSISRAQQPSTSRLLTRKLQFQSRHATDGKYLSVDQRVTLVLGFLPQELLGTSLYEYVASAELAGVAHAHKTALLQRQMLRTPPYTVRRKDGTQVLLQTRFKPFRNPWTKEMECIVAENTLVEREPASSAHAVTYRHAEGCRSEPKDGGADVLAECDAEVQALIDSHVESHKIGLAIAEEALRRSPGVGGNSNNNVFPLDLPPELLQDALLYTPLLPGDASLHQITEPLNAADARPETAGASGSAPGYGAGRTTPSLLDGNNEATMAVIMSLLEADAGLGGPVNFSGLPWPLP